MQAELTDERIAEMMTAGKWKLPEHEKILETLERDDQLKQILPYIQEVQGGFKEGLFPSSSFATCPFPVLFGRPPVSDDIFRFRSLRVVFPSSSLAIFPFRVLFVRPFSL